MRNDLVIRSEIMRSLTEEYNRRYKEGGLKLAWIEKAVNDVPEMWISVAERLPEIPNEYIVMIEGAEIPTTLYWTGDEWADIYSLGEDTYHVTHWMPLPEPPGEV